MELSIIIPSIRSGWFKKFMRSVTKNTQGAEYEVLENHDRGNLYRIINKEFLRATGKYTVLICDDCVVCHGWARRMIDFLDAQPALTVGRFNVSEARRDVIRRSVNVEYFGMPCSIIPCVNTQEVRENFGYLLDERFNRFYGDIDLSLRFWKLGGRVNTCPGADVVMFQNRDDIKKLAVNLHFTIDDLEFHKKWRRNDFALSGNTAEAAAV